MREFVNRYLSNKRVQPTSGVAYCTLVPWATGADASARTLDRIERRMSSTTKGEPGGERLVSTQRTYRTAQVELGRRRKAYARLSFSIVLGATAASADLLWRHSLATGLLLVGLVALLVLSAVYFWRVFARYALLAWYVTDGDLVREAGDLREMYRLAAVTRMRVKRTSDGRLRAIGLRFDDGRSLYVNALESPEEFLVTLRRECVVEPAEVKEPLDFDNPWFYRILGLAVGAMLSTVLRLVANIDEQSARIVYMVTGLFVVVSGTYWLYSRPIAQSYGHSKRFVDVIVGGASVLVGAVIAVVGFLWGSV